MSSIKQSARKTKAKASPRGRAGKALPAISGRLAFRISLGVATILIFVACLLFDTQALLQLFWLGVKCGAASLLAHRVTVAIMVMGVGLMVWGGWQVRIAPASPQRNAAKAVKGKNPRDGRSARPAQGRRANGQRRSSVTPRL